MAIPKIIHYVWVGNNEKPKDIKRCMETWKKHLKDYEIIEWNEKKFDVNEGVASFDASLGTNMGMNGCAGIYPALTAIMLAQITNTPIDLSFCIMLLVIIAISSFGIAGLPGTATIAISVVISGMGMEAYFPLLGAVIAVDPIIDMGRTMLNVSGTIASSIIVDRSLKRDEEKANKTVQKAV